MYSTLLAQLVLAICRKLAYSSLLVLLIERSYYLARDRLGYTILDLQCVELTFIVNYDASDRQISYLYNSSLEYNKGILLVEIYTLADLSYLAIDQSDIVELSISFGALALIANNDFLARMIIIGVLKIKSKVTYRAQLIPYLVVASAIYMTCMLDSSKEVTISLYTKAELALVFTIL